MTIMCILMYPGDIDNKLGGKANTANIKPSNQNAGYYPFTTLIFIYSL